MVVSREARKEIDSRLSGLRKPVDLAVFTQDVESPACRDTRGLAELFAELSPRVSVEVADIVADGALVRKYGAQMAPALVISSREGKMARIYGVPSGYGVWIVVDALRAASVEPGLSEATMEWLSSLEEEVSLTVVVGSASPICPAVAGMVLRMGLACRNVQAAALFIEGFPHLAVRHGIMDLPTVMLCDRKIAEGVVTEKALIDAIKAAMGSKDGSAPPAEGGKGFPAKTDAKPRAKPKN